MIAAGLLAWLLLRVLATTLTLLFFALIVAAGLAPLAAVFRQRLRLPHWGAVLVVFILAVLVLAGLLALIVPIMLGQLDQFERALPSMFAAYEAASRYLEAAGRRLGIVIDLPGVLGAFAQQLSLWVASSLLAARSIASAASAIVVVVFGAFFILLEAPRLARGFVRLFPPAMRSQVEAELGPISERLGNWIRGVLISQSALALMLSVGFSLVGLPFAVALGVFAGFLDIIPVVGGTFGAIVAVLVALPVSWQLALLTLGIFIGAEIVQANVVIPTTMARTVSVRPAVGIFAMVAGAQIMGLAGVVLALPITAVILVLIENLWLPLIEGRPIRGERAPGGVPASARSVDRR